MFAEPDQTLFGKKTQQAAQIGAFRILDRRHFLSSVVRRLGAVVCRMSDGDDGTRGPVRSVCRCVEDGCYD